MKKSLTIVMYIPNSLDATAFYRSSGVYGPLKKTLDAHYIMVDKAVDWNFLSQADILFMQRPWSDECVRMVWLAKNHKIPVIVDYDDELLAVPMCNKAFFTYQNPQLRSNIEFFRKEADYVTVTTEYLAERINNKNVVHVPNAWPDHILEVDRLAPEMKNTVLWRGGDSHAKDLMNVAPQLLNVIRNHKDWKFIFYGETESYWFLVETLFAEKCENVEIRPSMHTIGYLHSLRDIAAKIQIVPLNKDSFNMSKSNCAWIEGSWAGSTVLAPDFKEWDKPGVVKYNTPEGFEEKLECLINEWDKKNNEYSINHIKHNLLLSHVNKKRLEILKSLV